MVRSAVTPVPDPAESASIRALHEARARAELAAADALCPGADTVAWSGDLLAEVVLVKGMPGPSEAAGDAALSGADGEAILKALAALGWDPQQVFATVSRPQAGLDPARCAQRVHAQIEAIDPQVVVALDPIAAADVATGLGVPPLHPGREVRIGGRRIVALEGFESVLSDESAKRRVWTQLKTAAPAGPVY